MLDLVDENCLGMLTMPASITAGTNQETSCWVNHCKGVKMKLEQPQVIETCTYASETHILHDVLG